MGRWATFFTLIFVLGTLLAGTVDTKAVFASTKLNGDITDNATTVTVDSVTNFPSSGYAVLGNKEFFSYTSLNSTTNQFVGVTRGVKDPNSSSGQPDAQAWLDNAPVVSTASKTLFGIMFFNVITSEVSFGSMAAYIFSGAALKDLFKTLMWDYPWFTGPWIYARLVLLPFSFGFLFGVALILTNLAQGILRLV